MKKMLAASMLVALLVAGAWAQSGSQVVREMVDGARHLLASLSSEQKATATFSFTDKERLNWHFIPRERKGLAFKAMTPAQRKLAHAFITSGLSREGAAQAANIMYLEQILYERENQSSSRDPDGYFFSVFGEPSGSSVWGWRLEGHHLSLNFTLQDGKVISGTPAFFGANPAQVKVGSHRGLHVLAAEEFLGRRLLGLFTGEAREKVIINVEAPADILTAASREAMMGPPEGVAVAAMNREQSELLWKLMEVYAHRLHPELAESELGKIRRAGTNLLHFAWAGGSEAGQPHYYRIQGPGFVIEYDNIQNNANHVHTVWRDFDGDFGRDLLREHYAHSPHHAGQLARNNPEAHPMH